LNICRNGRKTYVLLDANCANHPQVQVARDALVRQLRKQGAHVTVLNLPTSKNGEWNGPDDYLADCDDQAMSEVMEGRCEDAENHAADSGSRKKDTSQAKELIALGEKFELFHASDATPYAGIAINDHREVWPTHSKGFKDYLAFEFFEKTGSVPGSQALRDALATLDGVARFRGDQHEVYIRIAADGDDTIWLDLADANWKAVKITVGGWSVVDRPTVRFRRSPAALPMPMPKHGGSLDELREFINLPDDNGWIMLVSWLVTALKPKGPYPILYLLGEQGSAKSTAGRVSRDLVDPYKAPLRTAPRDERDLYVAANSSWVVGFDNVSVIPPMLSDALCRLATGGGFGTRTLFTDSEETIFESMRPMVLNGISEAASRGDFLERCIVVNLPSIPKSKRLSEEDFWNRFRTAQPRILGALLDGVAAALRNSKAADDVRNAMSKLENNIPEPTPALTDTYGTLKPRKEESDRTIQ